MPVDGALPDRCDPERDDPSLTEPVRFSRCLPVPDLGFCGSWCPASRATTAGAARRRATKDRAGADGVADHGVRVQGGGRACGRFRQATGAMGSSADPVRCAVHRSQHQHGLVGTFRSAIAGLDVRGGVEDRRLLMDAAPRVALASHGEPSGAGAECSARWAGGRGSPPLLALGPMVMCTRQEKMCASRHPRLSLPHSKPPLSLGRLARHGLIRVSRSQDVPLLGRLLYVRNETGIDQPLFVLPPGRLLIREGLCIRPTCG
jgi:hypothetical protein